MLSKGRKNSSNRTINKKPPNEAFKKLARNNIKNSINNYTIYFITLTFGICLLYSFNSIDKHFEVFGQSILLESYIYMARGIIIFASVLICAIFAFLINYANQFLMRRRKREFGIYITLGMNKRDIINLMFKENVIIASIAFIIGVIVGMFAEQGISIITGNMIGIDPSIFKFGISISALIKTAIFFLVVLWFINMFNKKTIRKYELIDLLNSYKKNESINRGGKLRGFIVFLASLVSIACGYYIFIKYFTSLPKMLISIILIIGGTYYFFLSISDFLIGIIKVNKRSYYKNLNMFVISQVSSRIKTMGSTIVVICLLLFLATTIIPMGLGIGSSLLENIKETTPYDVTISRYNIDKEYSYEKSQSNNLSSIKDELISKNKNFPLDKVVKSTSEINLYRLKEVNIDTIGIGKYIKENSGNVDDYVYIITLNDFNEARKQQGLGEIQLEKNEFALSSPNKKVREIYEKKLRNSGLEVKVNSVGLKASSNEAYDFNYRTSVLLPENITMVVNDYVVSNLVPNYSYLNCNYIQSNNEYDDMFLEAYYNIRNESYMYDSKIVIDASKISMNVTLSYISLYLGIILLVTAGAVLALHQAAESVINYERFSLLKKLGVKDKDRKKAIFAQTRILYSLPLILALIHSSVINIGIFINNKGYEIKYIISDLGLTLIILFLVYGAYFIISCRENKNVIG